MNKTQTNLLSPRQWIRTLVLGYQIAGAVILIVTVLLAAEFVQTPFTGALFDYNLVVNSATPQSQTPGWNLASQGVGFGYQLLEVNGRPVSTPRQMLAELRQYFPGETIPVRMRTPQGEQQTFQVTLSRFGLNDQITFLVLPYLLGLVFLASGFWIFNLRRNETAGLAFAAFAASAAIASGAYAESITTSVLAPVWAASIPLMGATLIHLAMVFPQESRLVRNNRYIQWLGYILATGIIAHIWISMANRENPLAYASAWRNGYVLAGAGGLVFMGTIVYRRVLSESAIVRRQANTILVGTLGFVPITLWFILNILGRQAFTPLLMMPVIIFPIMTGYTVTRYRMLRTDYVISRSVLYALLSMLAIGGYMLIAIGVNLVFSQAFPIESPLLIALAVFYSVLLLLPIRQRLQEWIDSVFFRGQRAYQRRIQEFSRAVTTLNSVSSIIAALRENIKTAILPAHLHIFIYDPINDQYTATADESGRRSSDIRFGSNSPLVRLLSREDAPVFIDETQISAELENERTRLSLLGASLFVPLPGPQRLIGWLAMGERLSGENYTGQDLEFLDSITDQAAVALARSQTISAMERRVQELNALARIAQGINITLNFDDVLELIYAQTMQIISGNYFHLTLYSKTGGYYYHAFCLENNDRLVEQENKALTLKTTLEQEVIAQRKIIHTTDFQRECQLLGVASPLKSIAAWVGVPLNAGVETIGAMSVGTDNPNVVYTNAQIELLQAIADQAAGAIVKSRLLQETERRAQQLSTLNIIARQLASTLDLEPLLQNILDSAVSILGSEAGSLFLVDEQTGELVFRVTVGPVASNLVGQRLPPGAGIVGRVVTTRKSIIVNEAQQSTQWNSNPDQQTGFQTRALLAVPLEVKDRVIGVIEIINKRGGLPFTEEDETLLTAFAGQAAVAIENARLYTLTDQELAARVEELSVMQRIDRELNASLEVDRAMRITLEWAMRRSNASAGFIGAVYENGIQLIAEQGLGQVMQRYQQNLIPLSHPTLQQVLSSGQPMRIMLEENDPTQAFLPGARVQLAVPIRREANTIGLFLLESTQPDALQTDAQDFLSRLADHAAIAIANAQLYAEVQAASVAKSDFVSFVAHELKNPMTSIKGYTELLAAGAVGQINEMQSNFLSTIRSNVERMSTLVSDLNDNAKIEAGRLRLEFKSLNVADIIDDVVRSTNRQIEDKKQTIRVELRPNLPNIWADRVRVAQVLTNLVSNAHKYTPEGGEIVVHAEKTANLWDPQGPPEVVHIWVQDNGIGISPEDQRKIFQRFFRSDDQKARESPGTGLGLNITKSLVEMQGGKIWFESEFRKGTTFHFTVPIAEN